MLTLIPNNHLKTMIQLSGKAIRDFLYKANPGDFIGEARAAIKLFQSNPDSFSDEKLVFFGSRWSQAIHHSVRIEIRGRTTQGSGQIAAKGIWGPQRLRVKNNIAKQCKKFGVHLKLAGDSSIEFNVRGVDKALPIRFLQADFDHILKTMRYKPGPHIDARQKKTVIAADGDGTVYHGPRTGILPTLAESPVRRVLCAYLRAGGVFMLVSGNDLNRTFTRLVKSLPHDVWCRILVAANGGAELVFVDMKGGPVVVGHYRQHALTLAAGGRGQALDMIYIGDDGSKDGNDYPAFKAVGFKNSILVAPQFLRQYHRGLKRGYVGGGPRGAQKAIKNFLSSRV